MKINLRKILKKIATLGFSAVAVAATAGTALIPSKNETVSAANETGLAPYLYNVIKSVTGQDLSTGPQWAAHVTYQKLPGSPSYGEGIGNDVRTVTTGTYTGQTMDCVRSSIFLVGHALQAAGIDPTQYFSQIGYGFNGYGKFKDEGTDISKAVPGSILQFDNEHLGVALGWYNGELYQIDASSVYNGWFVQKYKGYAGSGATVTNLSHVYTPPSLSIPVDVTATIHKRTANSAVTQNNPNYSLADAVFNVNITGPANADGQATSWSGTMTTDANGDASVKHTFENMPSGTTAGNFNIKITEGAASKGFKLASGTYNTGATVPEPDRNDPVNLQITKRSDDGDVVKHPKDLANSEFTLKFYAVDPNTADVSNLTPARTWKLTPSHKAVDPVTGADCYVGTLDEATGDALYRTQAGTPVLPLGILTVQETKAPNGYKTTENKFIDVNNKNLTVDSKGVVTMRIFSDNSSSGASINFGHQKDDNNNQGVEYDVNDKNVRQGIKVAKYDYDMKNQKTQENAPDLRAHFVIINDNDYGVASIDAEGTKRAAQAKGDVVYDFETDKDGNFTSNNELLPTGNYIIKETVPPKGYTLHGNTQMPFSVTDDVTQDKKIIDLTGVQKDNAITDKVIRGTFKVQKNDLDLGTNTPQGDNDLSGKYALINRSANVVWVDTNGNGKLDDNEHFAPGDVINNRADATKNDPGKKIAYTFDTAKDGTYDWGEVQAEFPVKRAWYFKWKYSWQTDE